jgi:hypothetical protein
VPANCGMGYVSLHFSTLELRRIYLLGNSVNKLRSDHPSPSEST